MVLKRLFHDFPEFSFVSNASASITGYVMCRKAEIGYKLGPWICDPQRLHTARTLLATCLSKLEQDANVFIGVPAPNKTAVEILHEFGFEQYSKSIRMRYGKKLADRIDGVFAIGGPMKG